MSRHYLLYWTLRAVEYAYYGESLDHIASDQLYKVGPGDVVWVVTVRGGDLLLAGRLQVGTVIDEAEADAVFDDCGILDARWHAVAETNTAEPMQLVNLTETAVAFSLRFQSRADRLRINRRGRLNAVSLYHMRLLTDDSAALLNYVWYSRDDRLDAVERIEIESEPLIYAEGRPVVQTRVARQRNPRLVEAAKARQLELYGELRCEVCGISFEEIYGDIGEGYIEAHHPEPVSEMDGEQFTDEDDIVLVCANCHRMIHRKSPPYSIETLRERVRRQRQDEHKEET